MSKKSFVQASYGESFIVFPFQIARVEGKLLTLVESLGLRDSQEKATKDLVRDIVQGLYRDTEYATPQLTSETMERKRVLQENGEWGLDTPKEVPAYIPAFN